MNKRHGMMAVLLVALLLATSCSTFFTGGLSGKVKCDGQPVARARIAIYFDEGQRDADYNAQNEKFHTQYQSETQENGSFAITNIPWDSSFPEYGKDADEQTAYGLIYHEDYGYKKIDGITIISGRSNEIFPDFYDENTHTETITVQFMNPVTKTMESGVKSFDISYARPGFINTYKDTKTVNGGFVSFDIVYQGDTIPELNITNIKYNIYDGNKPYATVVEETPVGQETGTNNNLYKEVTEDILSVTVDANNNVIIPTIPLAYEFPGFRGSVVEVQNVPVSISIYNKGKADSEKPLHTVVTEQTSDTTFNTFSGLGSNITLKNKITNDAVNSEIKGYTAVIEEQFTIAKNDDKNVVTASSNPKAVRTVTVTL